MKRWSPYRLVIILAVWTAAWMSGCASRNIPLDSGQPLPPIVKAYKHVNLQAKHVGLRNTGIRLEVEDLVTILASGSLDYCPQGRCNYHNVRPELGWPLIARIGKESTIFQPINVGKNSGTFNSFYKAGDLYLGYRTGKIDYDGRPLNPEYYRDDSGSFSVDVIVWQSEDYVAIAEFLEKMLTQKPNSKPLADALKYADIFRRIAVEKAKTVQEVEQTEKEIQALKTGTSDSGGQAKTTGESAAAAQQVKALEARLENLKITIAKLDEMKKELDAEKQKTAELTQLLEEKTEREKDLLTQLSTGASYPPILVVASPVDGLKTEARFVRLAGVTEDDRGLQQLEISVNDRRIDPLKVRGIVLSAAALKKRVNFDQRIQLQNGTNRIRIRAVDSDGNITEKILTINRIQRRTNVWAVVIGINTYPKLTHLKYAVNDAKAFYHFLIEDNRIPKENVTLLVDQDATLYRLRSTLGTHLKKRAGQNDMVVIYFAGHGATETDAKSPDGDGLEKYILPFDADLKDLYASALPMREIAHIFQRLKSERLVFIVDSCYSGASGGRTVSLAGIRANISDAFLERVAVGKGRVIITASSANEVSVENDRFAHGIFTYFLLEGLRGKADIDGDGIVTVDETYRYVFNKVTHETGQEQHPAKKGSVEGRIVLSIVQ